MKFKFYILALLILNVALSLKAETEELTNPRLLTNEVNLITTEFDELLFYDEIKAFYDTLNSNEQKDIKNVHQTVRAIVEETVQKFSKLAEDNNHLLEKLKEYNGSPGVINFSISLSTTQNQEDN